MNYTASDHTKMIIKNLIIGCIVVVVALIILLAPIPKCGAGLTEREAHKVALDWLARKVQDGTLAKQDYSLKIVRQYRDGYTYMGIWPGQSQEERDDALVFVHIHGHVDFVGAGWPLPGR